MGMVCFYFFIFFSRCHKSWDANWFARAVFRSRTLAIRSFQLEKHEVIVLACQVGSFYLTFTQINSEMNCIAKNKCPDNQKLRDEKRRRGENFNACQEQRHVYFYILSLWFILCDARKDSDNLTFIIKESLILSNVCVIIGTRPIGDSTW